LGAYSAKLTAIYGYEVIGREMVVAVYASIASFYRVATAAAMSLADTGVIDKAGFICQFMPFTLAARDPLFV